MKAIIEEDKVLKSPNLFVLFCDFGDNALILSAYFGIGIKQIAERRMIDRGNGAC